MYVTDWDRYVILGFSTEESRYNFLSVISRLWRKAKVCHQKALAQLCRSCQTSIVALCSDMW